MKISETFKEMRKRNKISQSEIGKLFGVSHVAISNWENGKNDIPNSVIEYFWNDLNKILLEPLKFS